MGGKRTRRRTVWIRRAHHKLHHYFVPGAHNAYQPHLLRLKAVSGIAVLIVLLFVIALGIERLVIRSPSPSVGAVVAAVLVDLANADRVEGGLGVLAASPTLTEAAQLKANDMAAKSYFAHDTPEGFDPWHWFAEAGYGFRYAGENLAVYFSDSTEVEKAWMNSPLHRANILSERYTEIGIAIAHGQFEGNKTTFVVQMFGAPSEASAAAVVESREPEGEPGTVAGASAEAKPAGAIRDLRSTLWRVLTAPRTTLQYIYMGIASVVFIALCLLFLTELRRLHIPSLTRGVSLLVLIGVLLYAGTSYFSGMLLIL